MLSFSSPAAAVSRAFAEAWALVAPVDCAGCGAHDRALCPTCAPQLQSRRMLGTLQLAPPATLLASAGQASLTPAQQVPIVAALPYDGVARSVVLALKEQGRTELARALAAPLRTAVESVWHGTNAELLVPVPGSWAGTRHRGFQPVALVARRAGLVVTHALRVVQPGRTQPRAAPGAPQKSLTLTERLTADATRWRASPRVSGRRVVLVDDVVTSGATLRAAALALIAAGAEIAGCAAIAATPRRRGASSIPWRFWGDEDAGHGDNRAVEDYRGGKEA